jgi:hypothetical protein
MKEEAEAAEGFEAPPGATESSNNVDSKPKADDETPKQSFGTLMVRDPVTR